MIKTVLAPGVAWPEYIANPKRNQWHAPKLSPTAARELRKKYANGVSKTALKREYGIGQDIVDKVLTFRGAYSTPEYAEAKQNRVNVNSLKPEQVQKLKEMHSLGIRYKELEEIFCRSRYTLSDAINGNGAYATA